MEYIAAVTVLGAVFSAYRLYRSSGGKKISQARKTLNDIILASHDSKIVSTCKQYAEQMEKYSSALDSFVARFGAGGGWSKEDTESKIFKTTVCSELRELARIVEKSFVDEVVLSIVLDRNIQKPLDKLIAQVKTQIEIENVNNRSDLVTIAVTTLHFLNLPSNLDESGSTCHAEKLLEIKNTRNGGNAGDYQADLDRLGAVEDPILRDTAEYWKRRIKNYFAGEAGQEAS